MKTDLISASDLLVSLKAHYRNIEREHESDLAESLGNFKSIFLAQLETRTGKEVKALIKYLREVLGSVDRERWGDTAFRILLEKFPSDRLDSVNVIAIVKEYEIYAALGLILCEDGIQCLSNVGTADEFQQRYDALIPQLIEAAHITQKLKNYWVILFAFGEKMDEIHKHAKDLAKLNAGKEHASKAGLKGHKKHHDAKAKVIKRFIQGSTNPNNERYGEWPSISAASRAIKDEMNFDENVLASSNSARTIARWISEFLDPCNKKQHE